MINGEKKRKLLQKIIEDCKTTNQSVRLIALKIGFHFPESGRA